MKSSPARVARPLFDWLSTRAAGVLLHPTSLPGDQGVGTFDAQAGRFLDFLQAAGCKYWQLCPLGPTGYGDSPYQCFSAFAGNPYLIDLRDFVAHGLLEEAALAPLARLGTDRVDYGALYELKWPLLFQAHERYRRAGEPALYGDFAAFKQQHAGWLDAYAFFRALKDHHQGRPWWEWPAAVRHYADAVKSPLRQRLAAAIEAHQFTQYAFFGQWSRVKADAAKRGIGIIGDLPIFVAADSADVWANPSLFELDPRTSLPIAVAGVPPDYFSADGQLWGNPLYIWPRHAADNYAWWRERLRASFALYDIVRIDHFRGFEAYWRIPLPAKNARTGEWTPGPGLHFFESVRAAFPDARIIAEDLGVLTPEVIKLRDDTGLPGMAILQFAFGSDAKNLYLPHNLVANGVIYPGTHDNDTSRGWYATATEKERDMVRRYLRVSGQEAGWDFIRASYAAVSRLAVIPLQDILSLGSEARFNTPGQPAGNWQWRYRSSQLDALFNGTAAYLRELAALTGR
ncbi:MAG TPA: 4-alpha-glucanotransferase [Opitutaceae bacterium]|nr:4-alpha-glucanotransferase [Opitutaceae bacterium]